MINYNQTHLKKIILPETKKTLDKNQNVSAYALPIKLKNAENQKYFYITTNITDQLYQTKKKTIIRK